jgi:hypothetical protein
MFRFPTPRRPDVKNRKLQRALDWVDVAAYVFWVGFLITCGVLALIHGAGGVGALLRELNTK